MERIQAHPPCVFKSVRLHTVTRKTKVSSYKRFLEEKLSRSLLKCIILIIKIIHLSSERDSFSKLFRTRKNQRKTIQ